MNNSKFSLIYVDDEVKQNNAQIAILEEMGLIITIANNGKDALEMIKTNQYDILLSDYFMPIMTGEDLIRRVRSFNKKIFIILQTAYSTDKPEKQMIDELDINAYYDKGHPIDSLLMLLKLATRTITYIRENQMLNNELDIAKEAIAKAREDNEILKEQARLASIGILAKDAMKIVQGRVESNGAGFKMAFKEFYDKVTGGYIMESEIRDYAQFLSEEIDIFENNNKQIANQIESLITPKKVFQVFTVNHVFYYINGYVSEYISNCKFNSDCLANGDLKIEGYLSNLTQVITSLIHRGLNSYRYSSTLRVQRDVDNNRIDFMIEQREKDIILSIRDFGIPLSNEEKEDPSKQMISQNDFFGTSLGVGIYTAYSVVIEQMNGKLWGKSNGNRGTTYFISVPIFNN